ncbi:MAG: bacterial Ig-like domain-containing protein [Treponema sp.]|jgi:hypothetical protein|nr:bacterial Ig-like domain-containing protein [Treponema sp.]
MIKRQSPYRCFATLGPVLALFLILACEQPVNHPEDTPENPTSPENPTDPENPEIPKIIRGIAIASPPALTYYARNQAFDPTGLTVVYEYTDDTKSEALPSSAYTVDPVDTSVPGLKRVYVRLGTYTSVYFTIQVDPSDRILRSLEMTSLPTKTTYELGENFNLEGLVITGTYSDGVAEPMDHNLIFVSGYDKTQRGDQTISLRLNQETFEVPVTVKVPAHATVSLNPFYRGAYLNHELTFYKEVYIQGVPFEFAKSNLRATVEVNGVKVELSVKKGSIFEEDVQGFVSGQAGVQILTLTLDDASVEFEVYVADIEPQVYFDYGYMRQVSDPTGRGPGAATYYARPQETLVLAPVRVLLGFDEDHQDLGANYSWSVSGGAYDTAAATNQETFTFTPQAAGTYTVTVQVTGRNYVTSQRDTKTASTEVVCYTGTLPQGSFTSPLRNFACGQMTEGGTGYGWSLGSVGGYEVWEVEHQPFYSITGNPMGNWSEAGVVWLMEDKNGNHIPDEMWYELKGSDDDPGSRYASLITRRYSITYFRSNDTESINEFGQIIRRVYWVDSKGRTGILPGGWPSPWGVSGDWVSYTGTLLRDDGNIATGDYTGLSDIGGYVDSFGNAGKWASNDTWDKFYVEDAIRADGTSISLNAVKFIKVQTGIHRYGGVFGDCSTEINNADYLGKQTDFPNPAGGRE